MKANQKGEPFSKQIVKTLTSTVIHCDILSFISLLACKEYYKWGSSYGSSFSYIFCVPVKYTYSVFHLGAQHKMIPYFPEDNIPWTEEKNITKLVL